MSKYNGEMLTRSISPGCTHSTVVLIILLATLLPLATPARAQKLGNDNTPHATAARTPSPTAKQHRFWDRSNLLLFSGIAVSRGLDYASTRNMQARGREEILIPDDAVNNSTGFASLEAAGAAASIGISYLLHHTNHHKLERWLSIGHISVTGFGAARNYALESRPRTSPSPRR